MSEREQLKKVENDNKPVFSLITVFHHDTDKGWQPYGKMQELLDYINPVDDGLVLDKNNCEVYERDLPFYKDVSLIKIASLYPEQDDFILFFMHVGDDYIMLNGMSDYIHEVNSTGAIQLDKDSVFDYLKFFSFFVSDEETLEPFYVIEGENSEYLDGLSQYQKNRILRGYSGPRLISSTDNQSYVIESRLMFCGNIYDAKYKITADGMIVMTDDKHVGII